MLQIGDIPANHQGVELDTARDLGRNEKEPVFDALSVGVVRRYWRHGALVLPNVLVHSDQQKMDVRRGSSHAFHQLTISQR